MTYDSFHLYKQHYKTHHMRSPWPLATKIESFNPWGWVNICAKFKRFPMSWSRDIPFTKPSMCSEVKVTLSFLNLKTFPEALTLNLTSDLWPLATKKSNQSIVESKWRFLTWSASRGVQITSTSENQIFLLSFYFWNDQCLKCLLSLKNSIVSYY